MIGYLFQNMSAPKTHFYPSPVIPPPLILQIGNVLAIITHPPICGCYTNIDVGFIRYLYMKPTVTNKLICYQHFQTLPSQGKNQTETTGQPYSISLRHKLPSPKNPPPPLLSPAVGITAPPLSLLQLPPHYPPSDPVIESSQALSHSGGHQPLLLLK